MRVLSGVAALAALIVLGAFIFVPDKTTGFDPQEIEAEVLALADTWMDAWKDMDTDCETVVGLLHPDHWMMLVSGEAQDISEYPDYCARSTENRAGFSGDWMEKKVRVISPDAAVFVGTYFGTISYKDNRPSRHYRQSIQRLLVERTPDGWGVSWMSFANGPSEEGERS